MAAAVLLAFLFVSIADETATLLIRHSRLRQSVTAHLAAAFGRPVEVGDYSFTLWSGPEVTANSVSVAEDSRFGHEYFLRAESLSVRLRWSGLLRGHLVLGRVLLAHASLNLARNAAGDWNFAEWLPRPVEAGSGGFTGPVRRTVPGFVFNRIEVESGRINFKIGDEKLPFALVDVNGYVEPQSPSRWRVDLEAAPLRALVILQQSGTLRVAGEVGGTSSRLQPANLQLFWTDASLPDVLRLGRGDDSGLRGLMNLEIDAGTKQGAWDLRGHMDLTELHRWDLAARSDNPSLAVSAEARLDPARSLLQIMSGTIEAPHSHAHFITVVHWGHQESADGSSRDPAKMTVDGSDISLADLLAWIRAFRPDVAPDVSLQGTAHLRMDSEGWPPRLDYAFFDWDRAVLTGPRLRAPVHLNAGSLESESGRWSLAPVTLTLGESDGSLRLETPPRSASPESAQLAISGHVAHVRDLISAASAFGWNLSRGWDFEGPLRCDIRWPRAGWPWREPPQGTVDWGGEEGGASLQTPFLNLPVTSIRAHADWRPVARTISLAAADAFGGHWSGSLARRDTQPEWQFDLSADHLSAADLDRWLDPRWKQSFLGRLLPFLNARSPNNATPENLGAAGSISVGDFTLASASIHTLEGNLSVQGRTLELSGARAQMYGGTVSGSFLAELHAVPRYSAALKFSRIDLAALGQAFSPHSVGAASIAMAGLASGEVTLRAQGTDRSALSSSLACQVSWEMEDPEIRGINLAESLSAGSPQPGTSSFRYGLTQFTCANGRIRIPSLRLVGANQEFKISGDVDFARNVDLRLEILPLSKMPRILSATSEAGAGGPKVFSLTGNLSTLELRPATSSGDRK
jgi:hypothetical protein